MEMPNFIYVLPSYEGNESGFYDLDPRDGDKYHHSRVVEALQKENEENCRLLGMSAEREIQLLQKVQRLENLKAKLAETEWQPIETAPRDGTVFDVYTKYGRVTNCVACIQFGSIYNYDRESDNYDRKVNFATHWMPLPEPPTTEETK